MSTAETLDISDLDQFVKILTSWHSDKVAVLEHMLEMPEGTAMIVGEGDAAVTVVMTDDILSGFKAGLGLALMELGTLPFGYEMEPDPIPEPV